MPEQSRVVAGPASYTSGGFDVQFGNLKKVKYVKELIADGGYKAEVASVSGNTVKVKVLYYDYAAASAGTAIEVSAGADLSGVTFRITAEGI